MLACLPSTEDELRDHPDQLHVQRSVSQEASELLRAVWCWAKQSAVVKSVCLLRPCRCVRNPSAGQPVLWGMMPLRPAACVGL